MKLTHTPTPWYLTEEREGQIESDKGYIIAQVYQNSKKDYHKGDEANALHIVKCVNSHNELIEALKWALDYIELTIKLDGAESVDGESTQITHDKIKQALAKVGA